MSESCLLAWTKSGQNLIELDLWTIATIFFPAFPQPLALKQNREKPHLL
jgi:hypothetical protein